MTYEKKIDTGGCVSRVVVSGTGAAGCCVPLHTAAVVWLSRLSPVTFVSRSDEQHAAVSFGQWVSVALRASTTHACPRAFEILGGKEREARGAALDRA